MTWSPSPAWQPLTSGTGQSNAGVWRTPEGWVVKRLVPGVEDPRHHAYWRRQPLLAESRLLEATPGLRSPTCLKVEWDEEGATIWTAAAPPTTLPPVSALPGTLSSAPDPLFLARALGRFARVQLAEPPWGAQDVLRDRLATVARRGGWAALDPELPADLRHVVQDLWVRRDAALAELDALPRVPMHGDAHPGNLVGRDGDNVIAIDWEQFGVGPSGFDLGYLLLAVDLGLDDLLAAYGLPATGEERLSPTFPADRHSVQRAADPQAVRRCAEFRAVRRGAEFRAVRRGADLHAIRHRADLHAVRRGAVLTAAYTAVSRAAWSLTQPDPGDHLARLIHHTDLITEARGEPTS
jgi:hypothetical protein